MLSASDNPIIEYLKLLHDHGVGSCEAEDFKIAHSHDPAFSRRATAAELLYEHRKDVLEELDRMERRELRFQGR